MPATSGAALVNSMPRTIKTVLVIIMVPLQNIDTLDSFDMCTDFCCQLFGK